MKTMENKKIIGYEMKPECEKYRKAASLIANYHAGATFSLEQELKRENWGDVKDRLEKAGVLDLWFNPIYVQKETYEDVCKELMPDIHYEIINEVIDEYSGYQLDFTGNEAQTEQQLKALLALNKLKNVALYMNSKVNKGSALFVHMNIDGDIEVREVYGLMDSSPAFYTRKGAAEAIEILGRETIRLARSFGSL